MNKKINIIKMINKTNKYNIYRIFNEEGVLVARSKVKTDSDINSILELIEELNYHVEVIRSK